MNSSLLEKTPVPLPDWGQWSERLVRTAGQFQKKGMDTRVIRTFQSLIMDYYARYGRHDLPWRMTTDPYCIVVSEVMLQQTQVERVVPKYCAFVKTFPGFITLARAPLRRILGMWQGLGYNRRALALKRTARIILQHYHGTVPDTVETLQTLPGIGNATAGAICAYVYDCPVAFIETNIRTVYLHIFFPEAVAVLDRDIIPLIGRSMDITRPREWYQALMDFGVFIKRHGTNPNQRSVVYKSQSAFHGSDREIRGAIISMLIKRDEISEEKLVSSIGCTKKRLHRIIKSLVKDGLIEQQGSYIRIT